MRPAARRLALLALVAGCGRGLPDPVPEKSPGSAAVAPEPSHGCRPGALAALRGERRRVTVGDDTREALVDAPAAPAGRPLPVVLSFHGFRGSAWRHRWWTGWGRLAREAGFIALHPEGHDDVELLGTTGRGWDIRPDERRDADFVGALLDAIERERCVDRRRVFATGMSNGGFVTSLLGCLLADRLAAIAPVAGAMDLRACPPSRAVPILLIHGREDRIVPPAMVRSARDWWARVDGCDAPAERDGCTQYGGCAADVVYCEGAHAHRWPGDATARIWRFFQSHPLDPARGAGERSPAW